VTGGSPHRPALAGPASGGDRREATGS